MLKVIIVDDEQRICQMISALIDWQKFGFEVVATANDGITALAEIDEYSPDVVITDVRMPGLDGLNLISAAEKKYNNIDFIIISGYKHFEYAHSAIKQGVEYYLLKPIEEDELIQTLLKIKERRSQNEAILLQQSCIQNEISENRENLRYSFLSLVVSMPQLDLENIQSINKKYCCRFAEGMFQIFIIKYDEQLHNNQEVEILYQKIIDFAKIIYSPHVFDMLVDSTKYGVVCILNFEPKIIENMKKFHYDYFNHCKKNSNLFAGYSVTMGLGSMTKSIQSIGASMLEAINAIKSRILWGTGSQLTYSQNTNIANLSVNDLYTYKQESALVTAIENNTNNSLEQWFNNFESSILSVSIFDIRLIDNLCNAIIDTVISICKRLPDIHFSKDEFLSKLNIQLYEASSIKELLSILKNNIMELFNSYFSRKSQENSRSIRIAKQYIDENYQNEIRLEEVAKLVNYNMTYFSGVFKQEVGLNFSEYVIKVRMNHAKDLLRSTDLSIEHIAKDLGYNDEKYFSKQFHKIVGIKASEYRKLYR